MSAEQAEKEYKDRINAVNQRVDQIRTEYKNLLNKLQENDLA